MISSPLWFILAAFVSLALLSWLYHTATRRSLKLTEALTAGFMLNGLWLVSCYLFMVHVERGEYAALQTFGIILFAPMLFELFGISGLIKKQYLESQQPLVRVLLSCSSHGIGCMMTLGLLDGAKHATGIDKSGILIMLVSAASLISVSALTYLMLRIQPLERDEKRFLQRAARRMLITRVNLITFNGLLVYVGVVSGISGNFATTMMTVIFGLNLFAGSYLSVFLDNTALNPAPVNSEKLKRPIQNAPQQGTTQTIAAVATTVSENAPVEIISAGER